MNDNLHFAVELTQADAVAKVQSTAQGSLGNWRIENQLGKGIGDGRTTFGRRLADDYQERRQIRNRISFDFLYSTIIIPIFLNGIGAEEEIGSSIRRQRPADLPDAGHSHRLITSRMAPGEHDQLWVVAKQSPRCQSISFINCFH